MTEALRLHGYWRSGTSYRVRIALNIKGIPYEQITYDLRDAGHKAPDYLALNRQGLVPSIEYRGTVLTQSSAIIEWLEEKWPEPNLFPTNAVARAIVRSMAMIIACDTHPINNLRILNHLRNALKATDEDVQEWIARWITESFEALEPMFAQYGDGFAFGNKLSAADCHIIPQIYAAQRYQIDLSPFPHIMQAGSRAMEEPLVAMAHPSCQPDALV